MKRSRVINAVGLAMTATVLVVVLITKFMHGAWIAILAMVVLFVLMRRIHRHYAQVARRAARSATTREAARVLPSRVHAIVLVSKLHKPTMRALAYARATRPQMLEAITVDVDPEDTEALREEWEARASRCRCGCSTRRTARSPGRCSTYVHSIRRDSPRDLVVVYIPEYVVGHWWEQVLHNQSALRLKGRLLFTPGVMVAQRAVAAGVVRGADGARGARSGVPFRVATDDVLPTARPSSSSSRSARWPTAGTASPGTRAASSSSGTRCPASGSARGSPRPARPRFWRADAVEVLEASPDRVESAWPAAGPGGVRRVRARARGPACAARVEGRGARRAAAAAGQARPRRGGAGGARRRRRGGLGWRTRVDWSPTPRAGRACTAPVARHPPARPMPLADERDRGARPVRPPLVGRRAGRGGRAVQRRHARWSSSTARPSTSAAGAWTVGPTPARRSGARPARATSVRLPGRGRRVLAGAPRGAGPAGRRGAGRSRATSTAPRSSTSIPVPACSPRRWPTRWGRPARSSRSRATRAP